MVEKDSKTLGLRERKKAKTMASIQMHALRLFREQGYHETTVEQIAEAAEISPSTFFRYFRTKDEVMLNDNYDPLIMEVFRSQPEEFSAVQALGATLFSTLEDMSPEELHTIRERNQIIFSVSELRAGMLNNMTQTMGMLEGLVAEKTRRSPDDIGVRTLVGAFIGVWLSMFLYWAEHPEVDFPELCSRAMEQFESGLKL